MPNRETNKETEQYLEDKLEKIWSLAVLIWKKGKLTTLAVQNPCSHPPLLAEYPFSILKGPL